jgi:hypothetical protein
MKTKDQGHERYKPCQQNWNWFLIGMYYKRFYSHYRNAHEYVQEMKMPIKLNWIYSQNNCLGVGVVRQIARTQIDNKVQGVDLSKYHLDSKSKTITTFITLNSSPCNTNHTIFKNCKKLWLWILLQILLRSRHMEAPTTIIILLYIMYPSCKIFFSHTWQSSYFAFFPNSNIGLTYKEETHGWCLNTLWSHQK